MKKILITALAAVLAMTVLASCGNSSKNRSAAEDKATPAPTATVAPTAEPTEGPTAESAAAQRSVPDEGENSDDLMTADDAANDQVTIQNEIDSIKGLIEEGLYDDAAMQARALLTKNLTDADRELIRQYMDQLESYLGTDVSGLVD